MALFFNRFSVIEITNIYKPGPHLLDFCFLALYLYWVIVSMQYQLKHIAMIVRTTYLYKMHTDEAQTFGSKLLKCIENFDLAGLLLLVLYNKTKASLVTLSEVLVKIKQTEQTKMLKEAKKQRGRLFVSLRKELEGIALRRNKEHAALATQILEIIRQHGWDVQNKSQSKESSHITDIIRQIEADPKLVAAIDTFNLTVTLTDLKASQAEYEAIDQNRIQLNASKPAINGRTASKQVIANCIELIRAIDSLYSATQKREYMQMANLINEVVDAQAQVIRARITRSIEKEENTKMP